MSKVRVIESCVVTVDGLPFPLQVDAPYDSDDDIVRQFPWAFGLDNVEAATAAPGEKRNARR
jgi:hypothetical protein